MKKDKELAKRQQIASAVSDIQDGIEVFNKLIGGYDALIDEAAELGEDENSNQLIEAKVEAMDLVRNLKFVEMQIRAEAQTAVAFSGLKNVPKAIDAAKGLLRNMPNLSNLAKEMKNFKSSLGKATEQLKGLRSQLAPKKDETYFRLFGTEKDDNRLASQIKAEKDARDARLLAKISKTTPTPVETDKKSFDVKSGALDIDELTRLIDSENKKG